MGAFIAKEMESVVEVEKRIASSPHNPGTRNRGPKAAAGGAPPTTGRKGAEASSAKKRGRKDQDEEDEDDEPEEKRSRRTSTGRAQKDDDLDRSKAKASGRGRGGRRKG